MMRHTLPLLLLIAALLPRIATAQPMPETTLPETVVQAPPPPAPAAQLVPAGLGVRAVTLDRATIQALPQGEDTALPQALLHTPGVVQDALGEIHIRGEHRGLQVRLNSIALPEGLSGFGPLFDLRSFSSVSLLTGALPAQYGFRTNAVLALRTRQEPGGSIGLYGGSRGTLQPHATWNGTVAGWEMLASGSLLQAQQGIENPAPSRTARHGATEQARGLLGAARQLDDDTRLTLLAGTAQSRFAIPARPGVEPGYGAADSANLRPRQWERGWFGTAAVQQQRGPLEWQLAGFLRRSSINYLADTQELALNGVASTTRRTSLAVGNQADARWTLNDSHTLRFGGQVMREQSAFRAANTVFPLDPDGSITGPALSLNDRSDRTGWQYGAYAQDEWRLAERLTLNLGLRADQMVNWVAAGQLSPRASLVWRPAASTTLHAGYARTFSPPAQELVPTAALGKYVGTSNAPYSLENGAVRPERAHRFGLGVSQGFGPLTLGVEGYAKIVRDLLDYGQFGNALIFTPFNYRQGRVNGLELSASWRAARWLGWANLAYSRSEGRDIRSAQFAIEPDELAQVARKYVRTDHDQALTASTGASWRPWEGSRISATALAGSGLRRGFANSEKTTGYATLNLGMAQQFALETEAVWTARLDIVNLLDARYRLRDGTGIGLGAPQYGVRRGVFVGLTRSW